ncbi:MAG: hypothetical protein H7287_13130 [Thermoleophilia bacterium]|nr:hypothetical protein [Thermoleophilia bacterium]
MSERSTTSPTMTSASMDPLERGARFRRKLRGYDINLVDDALLRSEARITDLEAHVETLHEDLQHAQHETSETRHDLTRARAELRYWNDRATYVDSEVTRARRVAADLEQTARDRADTIEADAQHRSLQLVDRVCAEANTILQSAREEARDMFLRFETDVDISQQKLEKLDTVRHEIARTMQHALQQFEDAVREMDKVAPVKRIVEALEQPTRRPVPTFGQQKALEAAHRFSAEVAASVVSALSTPLTETLTASIEDLDGAIHHLTDAVDEAAGATAAANASAATPLKKSHDADEEFAALLMQP